VRQAVERYAKSYTKANVHVRWNPGGYDSNPPWYWLVIVTARLWLQVGFYLILFIAGLQRIPSSLYEAAYVDGARPGWQVFRHSTLSQGELLGLGRRD
jgi:ABC-type sugar transport system permease subunit